MLRPRIPVISRMAGVVDTLAPELLCDVFIDAVDANREERLAILNAANLQTRYETGIKILERQLLVMRTAARVCPCCSCLCLEGKEGSNDFTNSHHGRSKHS